MEMRKVRRLIEMQYYFDYMGKAEEVTCYTLLAKWTFAMTYEVSWVWTHFFKSSLFYCRYIIYLVGIQENLAPRKWD